MTLFVADIASYQAGLVPAALRPDCAALIVKCTQGSSYVDPDYAAWLDEARGAGLLVGAYHYVDNSPAPGQAANLAAHIIDPSLIVMLDEEQAGLAQALAVADAMTGLGLHVRLLYLARAYWSALGSPDLAGPLGRRGIGLVNAAYPSAAAARPVQLYPGDSAAQWGAYGGVVPALWQFTEAATEAGQRIDVSAYRGTLAELTDLFTTTPAAPAPASAPKEDDDMRTTSVNGRAGLPWAQGACHVFEVNYSSAGQPDLVLNAELKLTTGPVYLASLTVPHALGTAAFEIPPQHIATCRGVILTVKSGPANVVYDVCAV